MAAGIDEDEWNPATDVHIAEQYSASNFTRGKAKNKAALQRELGLPERADVPLVGFIGRLDYQKGADLVLAAAPWLISQDVQLICLGTGDSGLEVRKVAFMGSAVRFHGQCLSHWKGSLCP